MEGEKNSVLPDIITPISNAMHQNLPETEGQIDGVLSTVVGLFNNVVLYPVKKANMTFRYKLENFAEDLANKTAQIPAENLQVPPTMLIGPILEALRYAYDEEELREMFENLLASAMDSRKVSRAHPSFVDAITQMSSLDAKVLKKVVQERSLSLSHVVFESPDGQGYYPNAMPYYFRQDMVALGDPFMVSMAISNLMRLGLLKSKVIFFSDEDVTQIKKTDFVRQRYGKFTEDNVKIHVDREGIRVTLDNYGYSFAQTCIGMEENKDAD